MIRILVISLFLILSGSKAQAQSILDPLGLTNVLTSAYSELSTVRNNVKMAAAGIALYENAKTNAQREAYLCKAKAMLDFAIKQKMTGYTYMTALNSKIQLLRKYNAKNWKVSHLNTLNEVKSFVSQLEYLFWV